MSKNKNKKHSTHLQQLVQAIIDAAHNVDGSEESYNRLALRREDLMDSITEWPLSTKTIVDVLQAMPTKHRVHACIDCPDNPLTRITDRLTVKGPQTTDMDITLEDYRVHDELWDVKNGYLHIACLERRIGRRLRQQDFKKLPVNNTILAGFRLQASVSLPFVRTPSQAELKEEALRKAREATETADKARKHKAAVDEHIACLDGHVFVIHPTGDSGINSGRDRVSVYCTTCKVLVHENITGPEANMRIRFRHSNPL